MTFYNSSWELELSSVAISNLPVITCFTSQNLSLWPDLTCASKLQWGAVDRLVLLANLQTLLRCVMLF